MKIKNFFKNLTENSDLKMVAALLFATVLLFVYFYFGSFSAFEKYFPNTQNIGFWKIIYHNCMSFVLFFVVGGLFSKFVLKNNSEKMGLKLGNSNLGTKLCLVALIIVPLVALSTVLSADMTSTYPLVNLSVYNEWYYILGYFASYFLYYVGWEFLFRSIILFNCEEKCGVLGAIVISTMLSALVHSCIAGFGKPMVETLSAIPAGLIFGYITSKTKSIWYSLFIHMLVGFLTDMFIILLV